MPRKLVFLFALLLTGALIFTLPAALTVTPAQAQGGSGVLISNLNLRAGPSGNDAVITTLTRGATVTILGRNRIGDWLFVSANGMQGWVASRYVDWDDSIDLGSLPITEGQGASSPGVIQGGAPLGEPNAWPVQQLNLRAQPTTNSESLGLIPAGTGVVMTGRTADGLWVFVATNGGTLGGWLYLPFLSISLDVDPNTLPVTDQVGGAMQPPESTPQFAGTPTPRPDLTNAQYQETLARLQSAPVLPQSFPQRVYLMRDAGRQFGVRAHVFTTIGDCHTDTLAFFRGFGEGNYDLGPYGNLQATIDFFNESPYAGSPNPFAHDSLAANSAFTSGAVLDPLWSNPYECAQGESPIACEFRRTNPAVAIILVGTVDAQLSTPALYEIYLTNIIYEAINRGIIPVLTTIPNHPDHLWLEGLAMNAVVLDLAEREEVPLINLWRALQDVPNYGLAPQDNFHLLEVGASTHFGGGEETQFGMATRNLVTLQMLDLIRAQLLQ